MKHLTDRELTARLRIARLSLKAAQEANFSYAVNNYAKDVRCIEGEIALRAGAGSWPGLPGWVFLAWLAAREYQCGTHH